MPIIPVTRTINQRTGVVTNTITTALGATDTITGVVLRGGIQQGVIKLDGTMVGPAGIVAQVALPTTGEAAIVSGQGPIDGTTRVFDVNGDISFTFNTNRTAINVTRGTNDPAFTIDYQVFDNRAANLTETVKVRPTNVTATVTETVGGTDFTAIVLKNGPHGGFTQTWRPSSPSGLRVNDVVEALLTQAE